MNSPHPAAAWKKSSYSKSSYCVEVAQGADATVVCDSKESNAGGILLTRQQWSRFLAAVKGSAFNLWRDFLRQ